ncbi:sensor histidine kinase [Streptomyces sp. NPDC126933]|uniref:sensor histidine kinase n=1 Tax=unclassified Streptomyces TaxID=2593676 RepID=UPI00366081B6
MSQLRAPVRPERREGGRHGRPGTRSLPSTDRADTPTPLDARIRPQLLRTAVLPAIVAALSGAAAVMFVLRSTATEPTAGIWLALVGTALLAFAAVAAAALGADRTAKSVLDRCNALRRSSARGQADLRAVVEQLRRGERVPARRTPTPPAALDGDEFDLLAEELGRSQESAVGAVVRASRLSSSVGNEQKMEVFVNLARRLQSLAHREIQLLDELENEVEDPDLLKGLFHVDHLATRVRRYAENLAVLGGAVSRRQWSEPVLIVDVLRSAVAEVEQYPRIKLVPPIDGTLRGHAVADVVHLLAELLENATLFSAPHTQVLLRAQQVAAGIAIEVEDRGPGMPLGEQKRMNSLLADPDQVNVAQLLGDGRIGLFVASALARRHGIAVRLQSNIYGGVQAVLILPQALLGSDRAADRNSQVLPPVAGAAGPVPAARVEYADRPALAEGGTVRGIMSRPQLPKRRGQEHLVPQPRDLPPPRPSDEPTLHDPGLMAAFQRGIGLAESQPGPPPEGQPEPRSAEPRSAEPQAAEPRSAVAAAVPRVAPLTDRPADRPADPMTDRPAHPLANRPADPLAEPLPDQPESQRHDTTPKERMHHGER